MYVFQQSTGNIYHQGQFRAQGYAGNGEGKNNPAMQNVPKVGPPPRGIYSQGDVVQHHPRVGEFAIPLIPDPANQMEGRSEFFCHGDSFQHPGEASDGCIVAPRWLREEIAASQEKIQVVE